MKKIVFGIMVYVIVLMMIMSANAIAIFAVEDPTAFSGIEGTKIICLIAAVETAVIALTVKPWFRWLVGKKAFKDFFEEKGD